jgi:hypothetical protein
MAACHRGAPHGCFAVVGPEACQGVAGGCELQALHAVPAAQASLVAVVMARQQMPAVGLPPHGAVAGPQGWALGPQARTSCCALWQQLPHPHEPAGYAKAFHALCFCTEPT